jgi:hypothetical protein
MNKKIPDHWVRVEHGMGGVWIERNVHNHNSLPDGRMDVIHVPAWDLRFETNPNVFTTDEQIQHAIMLFGLGMNQGRELGITHAQAEMRKALGITPQHCEQQK